MKVEVHSIGNEVYFINDKQKVDFGYITEVYFEMKRGTNSDGYSLPITQNTVYVIDDNIEETQSLYFIQEKI